MSWAKSVLWVVSGYALLAVSSLVALFIRRDRQPVKFRGPWLVLCSGIGALVNAFWLFLYMVDIHQGDTGAVINHDVFCDMGQWIVWVTYPLFILPYLLRGYRLYYIFHNKHTTRLVDDPRYWKRLVITESYLLRVLFVVLSLCAGINILRDQLNWSINIVGYGCDGYGDLFWSSLHIVEFVFMIFVMVRLRYVRDDYGMTEEFKAVSVVWAVCTTGLITVSAMQPSSHLNDWLKAKELSATASGEANAIIVIIRNTAVLLVSVIYPVYNTFSDPFVPLWSNCDALRSLDSLLRDIVCITHFRDYLTTEGRVETILCWVEIELYKDIGDPDFARLQANRIFDKYLNRDAKMSVQISDGARRRVEVQLERGVANEDTFVEVQMEIFRVMNEEFPRFLASDNCRQCLKELEREEHIRSVLENSGMI